MALFGKGMIKNNKRGADLNRLIVSDMIAASEEQSRATHWGLVATLLRVDDNGQDFLNNCDEYPEYLPIHSRHEMEEIFDILSKRIDFVLGPRTQAQRWEDDFFYDLKQQQSDALVNF